jgi:hypothetical protein
MIAAIALHHGLELATGDTSHFQRLQTARLPADPGQLACLIPLSFESEMAD